MTSAGKRKGTVSREEAESLARSGLSATALCLWCLGLMVLPAAALAIALSMMS